MNVANPAYVYVDDTSPSPKPGFLIKGIYKFTLVVNDGELDSSPDTVMITADSRNIIAFEDSCFEISIRVAVGMPNASITNDMLLSIDSLLNYSGYYRITSLEGIEDCKNLEFLSMSSQSITDLSPLAGLTKLQSIALDQNYTITDITPLAGLTNLTKLNLQDNKIVDVSPLQNLTQLKSLMILNNPITDVSSLTNLTDLTDLWIGHTERYGPPLIGVSIISRFTNLYILWLTHYNLNDNLTFIAPLSNLKLLHLGFSNISDLTPIANCSLLIRLYLDSNGTNPVRLTFNSSTDYYPKYSSDGTKIAFASSPSPTGTNIWIMNNDGSDLHQVTDNGVDATFSWSPTGEKIVYTRYQTTDWTMNNGVLWMIDVNSKTETQFTFNP